MRELAPLLAIVPVLVSACVSSQEVDANFDQLIGQPASAAVGLYGPPDNVFTLGDSTWYKWRYTSTYYGSDGPLTCEWSVEMSGGEIVAYDWLGNEMMCVERLAR